MSTPNLSSIRAALTTEQEDIEGRLAKLHTDGDDAQDFDENFADSAQVTAEQVENRSLAANLQDQLEDVEAALVRIDEGSYGVCVTCGKTITAARLEAMPSTKFCIDDA